MVSVVETFVNNYIRDLFSKYRWIDTYTVRNNLPGLENPHIEELLGFHLLDSAREHGIGKLKIRREDLIRALDNRFQLLHRFPPFKNRTKKDTRREIKLDPNFVNVALPILERFIVRYPLIGRIIDSPEPIMEDRITDKDILEITSCTRENYFELDAGVYLSEHAKRSIVTSIAASGIVELAERQTTTCDTVSLISLIEETKSEIKLPGLTELVKNASPIVIIHNLAVETKDSKIFDYLTNLETDLNENEITYLCDVLINAKTNPDKINARDLGVFISRKNSEWDHLSLEKQASYSANLFGLLARVLPYTESIYNQFLKMWKEKRQDYQNSLPKDSRDILDISKRSPISIRLGHQYSGLESVYNALSEKAARLRRLSYQ